MKTAKHYIFDLRRSISQMSKSPEQYCKNPGRDYTRNRKITMKDVFTCSICLAGKSMSNELLQYFSCKPNFPTVSAFSQQRDKLSENAFPELFQRFSRKNIPNRQINGYRLLAVDGSTLCTPANPMEKDSYFPSKNRSRHFNLLHIHAMYDLLSNTYVDAIVEGGQVFNERAAFNRMVDRSYIPKAIVMTDRGYEAFNTAAHCVEKGFHGQCRCAAGVLGVTYENLSAYRDDPAGVDFLAVDLFFREIHTPDFHAAFLFLCQAGVQILPDVLFRMLACVNIFAAFSAVF